MKCRGPREMEPSFLVRRGVDTGGATRVDEPLGTHAGGGERPPRVASRPEASPHLRYPDRLKTHKLRFEFRIAVLEQHRDDLT